MLSVTVIGGYLGAGKTTLVNHLLRNADGQRLAVLVNEFGALPIDQDMIEAMDENVISIAGGCVCCSYGNDLVQAMLDLAKRDPAPDHVLLEASGVALPGAIASSVSLLPDYRLDGIVVLADAETIRRQAADEYVGDTIERQLSDADIILLNKTDLIPSENVKAVVEWLGSRTQNAEVIKASYCQVPRDIVLQAYPTHRTDSSRADRHQTTGIYETRYLALQATVNADVVAMGLADESLALIRAKGFVKSETGLKTIQVVGRRWAVSDAPTGAEPGIVVIAVAAKLDLDAIIRVLIGTQVFDPMV